MRYMIGNRKMSVRRGNTAGAAPTYSEAVRLGHVLTAGRDQAVIATSFSKLGLTAPTAAWDANKYDSLEYLEKSYDPEDTDDDDIEHVIDEWQTLLTSASNDEQRAEATAKLRLWRQRLEASKRKKAMEGNRGSSGFKSFRYNFKKDNKTKRAEKEKILREYADLVAQEKAEKDKGGPSGTSVPLAGGISAELTVGELATISSSAEFATSYPRSAQYLAANPDLKAVLFGAQ